MTAVAAARSINFIILLVAVDLVLSAIFNDTLLLTNSIETRRAKKKEKKVRSTSSSSNAKRSGSSGSSANSLDMTSDSDSSSGDNNTEKAGIPVSSAERHGWRKWHRKCTPCPVEMKLKWRDPNIKWICGAYQRARRSFKSLCMMHYRNCQDGTMFIKVSDYRCQNDSQRDGWKMGEHFFYDYNVRIRDDKTDSGSETDSQSTTSASSD